MNEEKTIEKTENWTMLEGDCVNRIDEIEDNTIDFSIYSPPFSNLYVYSDNIQDMGNTKDDELSELTQGKRYVWCLITAWLPELCPPYEDRSLYAERPGQVDIFNYVKTHFTRVMVFSSRYPVEIYFWGR